MTRPNIEDLHGCTSPCAVCDMGCRICNKCPCPRGSSALPWWKDHQGKREKLYCDGQWDRVPVLTVERRGKWYSFWLVVKTVVPGEEGDTVSWSVTPVARDELPAEHFIDHVPNPREILRFAYSRGWRVDLVALGAMRQAWMDEGGK